MESKSIYFICLGFYFRPENKGVLSLLSAASLLLVWLFQLKQPTSMLCKVLFAVGATATYCFRADNGALSLAAFYDDGAVSK